MNYVLILAGPIVVALAAFSTYASMVRTGVVFPCSAYETHPPKNCRHVQGTIADAMQRIPPALHTLYQSRERLMQIAPLSVRQIRGASGRATS